MTTDPIFDIPEGFPRLIEVMRRLRDPEGGCPWDIEQDFASIAPYTIEEAHEVADAIEREAWGELEGELGDLLLQVIYHGQMGAEAGHFDTGSIARRITDKMIARHPHVFGPEQGEKSAEQQTRDWETAKAAERAATGETRTLDGVALGLPALLRALKLQKRLSRVGFDWGDPGPVLDKMAEEIAELEEARKIGADATEDEFGDLLFVLVNLARHWGVDPEAALRRTNAKVERRFAAVEDALAATGRSPAEASLQEMDALWDAAKIRERAAGPTDGGS
ncbi:MAG: nucleoside triphosphate pyrophosphohydrolase [Silicimonas sp.]|nr:nucleoside triphosphate pyrophosphohydrolase [Silicimonas sp.]